MSAKHSKNSEKPPSYTKGDVRRYEVREVLPKLTAGWRLWLFRIIALTVIPALLFLLLELGLRMVGSGFPTTATIKCKVDGKDFYGDNLKFSWRFFPRKISRVFFPFVFPADKPDETCRIFVLGASAAMGFPDQAFCFGRFLRAMLRQQYPGVNFEVINAAMTAINSHVVLEVAKDCTRHNADLLIVYLGNNEVTGPYGAGTVFTPFASSLSLIRLGIALKAIKLGQMVMNLSELVDAEKNIPTDWGGMEMFPEKQIRADDARLETVYQHFQRNLKDIIRLACKSKTRIVLCTVGSNLKDNPPFASLHRLNLTETEKKKWDEIYQQGVAYETAGKYGEAVEYYLAAAEIDDGYADLQFRLGRCYWALAEYNKAKDRYIRARELDTLRFRADKRINEIIRNVAGGKAAKGVYLVDAVKAFERNSPYETIGEELFYEHVHLNFKGNYLLAKTIFEQAEKMLPERIKRHKVNKHPLLTEGECARYLVYADWARYEIINKLLNTLITKAPFTNQLYHKEYVRQMEQEHKNLKTRLGSAVLKETVAQYRLAIQDDSSDLWLHWKYAELLSGDLKNHRAAVKEYRLLVEHLPHSHRPHVFLGVSLAELGDFDAAIAHYLEAIRIKPTGINVYLHLGTVYQKRGRLKKAAGCYSKAMQYRSIYEPACQQLGVVLYLQGKIEEAIEVYRNGLLVVPNSSALHYNLGVLLGTQGHRNEAVKELRTALQIDPDYVGARRALRAVLGKPP